MAFVPDAYQYTQWEKRWDADGKVWMQVQAHDTLVAKTPYGIVANEYGWITQALPAAGKYIYVGVPEAAAVAADILWVQIGGKITDMITASLSMAVGEGCTIDTGAVADIAADYSGAAGEFFVASVATTTSTTQTGLLIPEKIITI